MQVNRSRSEIVYRRSGVDKKGQYLPNPRSALGMCPDEGLETVFCLGWTINEWGFIAEQSLDVNTSLESCLNIMVGYIKTITPYFG